MAHEELVQKLKSYYSKHGIGAVGFRCRHQEQCRSGAEAFAEAREPHIGTRYGDGVPRLSVVSLDPGSADYEVEYRAIERRNTWEPGIWRAHGREKTRHWYRTLEIVKALLCPFDPALESMAIEDMEPYFAHLNSARCCQNKEKRRSADRVLFDNCREFLAPELVILAPDIVVTQGDYAKWAVKGKFPVLLAGRLRSQSGCPVEYWVVEIGHRPALWFHTYHPSMFGKFNKQRSEAILPPSPMALKASEFVRRQGRFKSLEG
jgi:hypothetical protein